MAISDTQKLDYLFKKLGFAVTKTDTNANKAAANESIASPLLIRGDKVWQQASDIPSTIPGTSSTIVQVYGSSDPIECTGDIPSPRTGHSATFIPHLNSIFIFGGKQWNDNDKRIIYR